MQYWKGSGESGCAQAMVPDCLSSAPNSITGCVSLGSLLNLSGPQLLQLKVEIVRVPTSIGLGMNEFQLRKCLEQHLAH